MAVSQQNVELNQTADAKIVVLNPACSSTLAERVPLAPRTFADPAGKTVFYGGYRLGRPESRL